MNGNSVLPRSRIQYVFVLVLENHSFDQMLALSGIPGVDGATTANFNSYLGTQYPVQGNAPASMPDDPGHEFADTLEQLAGPGQTYPPGGPYPAIDNSGFVANYAVAGKSGSAVLGDIMKCFDTRSQLPVIYQLATEFVVCDHWFASMPGPTWPNRFFLHGASSNGLDHSPSMQDIGLWEATGFTYPQGSIFDALTARRIGWRLYRDEDGPMEGRIPQACALHNIHLWDFCDVGTFAADLNKTYPWRYTLIEPNYGAVASTYEGGSSQHPLDGVARGEALMAKLYESLRNSPLWNESLLIITYDEHGGFYDHVAPGAAPAPADGGERSPWNESQFTFTQLGVRVPALVISPWLQPGVDSTIYDHASILATVESLFGVPALTERDRGANPIHGLDVAGVLRTDCPTQLEQPAAAPARAPLAAVQQAALDAEPIPDRSSTVGFLGVARKTDHELSAPGAEQEARRAAFAGIRTRGHAREYMQDVLQRAEARRLSGGSGGTP
ncbi:MAG: alkaline phosphatase family protein [Acidobacteriaceae bacterium]